MTSSLAGRRAAGAILTAALALAGAAVAAPTAVAADATPITNARFDWGVSGYAQQGVFAPWTFSGFQGDASYLDGAQGQAQYAVAPFPATSLPVGVTPNAVRFAGGEGTVDAATGDASISWTGSYTINAYPAQYGAPSETYADPQLVVADGSATLSFDVSFGAGTSMGGEPIAAVDAGRLVVVEVDAVDLADLRDDGIFTLLPDYQGVVLPTSVAANQTTSCDATAPNTGWWGSWPEAYVAAVPSSLRSHFYSTGCAGSQDKKPALPVAVDLGLQGAVTVSQTTLAADGTTTVTVQGRNFAPWLATGTRPPFAGLQSGVYVAFARAADVWRPSAGATTTPTTPAAPNKNGVSVIWAVPQATLTAGNQSGDAYTVLDPDGTFTATIKVNQAWLAAASGNLGIYTYAGGGAKVASYETFTPLTFVGAPSITTQPVAASVQDGAAATFAVAATGHGTLAYQWQARPVGGAWTDVPGARSASYTVTSAAGLHGTEYRVVVTNLGGAVTSAAVTLTVTAKPAPTPAPVVKATPVVSLSSAVRYAGTATVSVKRAAGQSAATGTVTLRYGAATVGTGTLKAGTGTAKVALSSALPVGAKRALTVTYSGDAAYQGASVTKVVKVAKASSSAKATLARKKVAAKAKATVRVTVAATGTTPSGKVRVTATKGKKTVTRTVTLKKGKATATLPRLAKGAWTVKATYVGSAKVTSTTSAKVRLTVR